MSYVGNTNTTQGFIPAIDYFSGNGSTVAFTLSRPVASVAQVQANISNVPQNPSSAFSVSGNTITFTSAPPSGTNNIYVYYTSPITQVIAPGQGTVTSESFGTIVNFTTTGNTILGDASTDTLNVGNGDLVKDASGNVGIGTASPTYKIQAEGSTPAYFGVNSTAGTQIGYAAALPTNSVNCYVGWIPDSVGTGGVNGDLALQPRTSAGANIRFFTGSTSATECARINSSGNLLVGTTSSVAKLHVLANAAVVDPVTVSNSDSGSGSQFAIVFRRNTSTVVGSIQTTNVATSYVTSSDYRLKNSIAPMTGALEKVVALKPVTYKWNADNSESQGFIAHELQEIVPDCVTGEKDAVDADGNPQYQGIDTSFLVATLTAAIQEQQAIITSLTDRITALENK
jgi:hypothetical protein